MSLRGSLRKDFVDVTEKTLAGVEQDSRKSHQHELDGDRGLQRVLGTPASKQTYSAAFLYVTEDDEEIVREDGSVTWYDSRVATEGRTEWRLYYTPNGPLDDCAAPNDLAFIGLLRNDTVVVIVAEQGSEPAAMLSYLFDGAKSTQLCFPLEGTDASQAVCETDFSAEPLQHSLETFSRQIRQELGIGEEMLSEAERISNMARRFPDGFPAVQAFCEYVQEATPFDPASEDPDNGLQLLMQNSLSWGRLYSDWRARKEKKEPCKTTGRDGRWQTDVLLHNFCYILASNGISLEIVRSTGDSKHICPAVICPAPAAPRSKKSASVSSVIWICAMQNFSGLVQVSDGFQPRRKYVLPVMPAAAGSQTREVPAGNSIVVLPKALHETCSIPSDRLISVQALLGRLKSDQYAIQCLSADSSGKGG